MHKPTHYDMAYLNQKLMSVPLGFLSNKVITFQQPHVTKNMNS